jgi:hypothetical protein
LTHISSENRFTLFGICFGSELKLTHDFLAEPVDLALAAEGNQRHIAFLPWFEAHSGASGNIQPATARFLPVE